MPKRIEVGTCDSEKRRANDGWIDRQCGSDQDRREYEQERLIVWVTEAIAKAMLDSGKSQADLAEILGTSRANISQLFSGQRNMTLRTLADLAWACDARISVTTEPLRQGRFVSIPVALVKRSIRKSEFEEMKEQSTDAVATPADGEIMAVGG